MWVAIRKNGDARMMMPLLDILQFIRIVLSFAIFIIILNVMAKGLDILFGWLNKMWEGKI